MQEGRRDQQPQRQTRERTEPRGAATEENQGASGDVTSSSSSLLPHLL